MASGRRHDARVPVRQRWHRPRGQAPAFQRVTSSTYVLLGSGAVTETWGWVRRLHIPRGDGRRLSNCGLGLEARRRSNELAPGDQDEDARPRPRGVDAGRGHALVNVILTTSVSARRNGTSDALCPGSWGVAARCRRKHRPLASRQLSEGSYPASVATESFDLE